jgi:hypothetical protein
MYSPGGVLFLIFDTFCSGIIVGLNLSIGEGAVDQVMCHIYLSCGSVETGISSSKAHFCQGS